MEKAAIYGKEKVRKGSAENPLKWQHSKNTYARCFSIKSELGILLKNPTYGPLLLEKTFLVCQNAVCCFVQALYFCKWHIQVIYTTWHRLLCSFFYGNSFFFPPPFSLSHFLSITASPKRPLNDAWLEQRQGNLGHCHKTRQP